MTFVFGSLWSIECKVLQALSEKRIEARALINEREKAKWVNMVPGIKAVNYNPKYIASNTEIMKDIDILLLLTGGARNFQTIEPVILDLAIRSKSKRIVCLSAYNFITSPNSVLTTSDNKIEKSIIDSGLDYTIIKTSTPMDSLLYQANTISKSGFFTGNMRRTKISLIDTFDIAKMTAVILSGNNHKNKTYHISGPESLSFKEVARILSKAVGRRIKYYNLPVFFYRYLLSKNIEVPDWYLNHSIEFSKLTHNLLSETVTDTLNKTGKLKPTTLEEFAKNYLYLLVGKNNRT